LVHRDEFNHVDKIQVAENFFNRKDWHFIFDKKPTLLYGDQEILKGVTILNLPGHTPGTTGALLQLDRTGAVLLTDDAIYTHDSYGPPAVGTVITWDVPRWGASMEKIRRIATEHNAFLIPGATRPVSRSVAATTTRSSRRSRFTPSQLATATSSDLRPHCAEPAERREGIALDLHIQHEQ
jgi:glyoxylase-like metal-dependent hydrolase (beta-lactamase superfamily II)